MSHLTNVREGVIIPENIDYKTYMADRPTYRRLIVPPTGSNEVKLQNATMDSYFEITPNVFNISQSHLEYNVLIPDLNTKWNYSYKNKPNVQNIQVYTKSGVNLVQLDYVNKYVYTVGRKNMKFGDYITRSSNSTCAPLHGSGITGAYVVTSAVNKMYDRSELTDLINENQYLIVAPAVGDGAGAGNLSYSVRFPFSDISDTLLSMDKDLYFKENLIVKITWEPQSMFGFTGDDEKTFANATELVGGVTLSNVQLRLAIQTNRKLIESTMALVNSGLQLDIPFVTTLRNSVNVPAQASAAAGTVANVNVKINSGMGRSLIKVIHTVFNGNESKNTAFDNSNLSVSRGIATYTNLAKIASYYTQLNSQRIQDYLLTCSTLKNTADDYQWNEFYIKNSPIMTPKIYMSNWFHEDNFSNINNDSGVQENQISTPGIPLENELTWYFFGTTGTNNELVATVGYTQLHHTFVITRKTLNISPMGVTIA